VAVAKHSALPSAQDLPLGSLEGEKEIKPVPPFNLHEFMQTAKLPIFAS
jgi:hypothetical protein